MIYLVALLGIFMTAIVCLTVRREVLPSLALVLYALIPLGYLAPTSVVTIISPSLLVLTLWAARERLEGGQRGTVFGQQYGSLAQAGAFVIGLFAVWLIVKTVFSDSIEHAVAWSAAFLLLAVLPLFTAMDEVTASRLKSTWILISALLSFFGLVEYWLAENPIYAIVYESAPFPIHQYWSSYRITTSLGHPLWNSLFFAIGASMAVGRYAETGRYRWLALGGVSVFGVFLTVSRSGVIAVAVAISAVALARIITDAKGRGRASAVGQISGSHRLFRGFVIATFGVLGILVVLQSATFGERSSSSNGIASFAARVDLFPLATELSQQYGHMGAGAGNSNVAAIDFNLSVIIENSYLQLLVSLGVPGVILFSAMLVVGILAAFKARSLAVGAGLIAYSVAIGGFNWLEANRSGLFLLGILLAIAFSDLLRRGAPEVSAPSERAKVS